MSITRKLIRIWLTISSLIGFVIGWIFLSHTVEAKAVTRVGNTVVQMPEIQAIPTLNSSGPNNVQTFSLNPNSQQQSFAPSFRTGGS
jgi:hypothetical protein